MRYIGDKIVPEIRYGNKRIMRIYHNDRIVFEDRTIKRVWIDAGLTTSSIEISVRFKTDVVNIPRVDNGYRLQSLYFAFISNKNNIVIEHVDTKNVRTFESCFAACDQLTTLYHFDLSSATTLYRFAVNCKKLTDIPDLDFSNVVDMRESFSSCAKMKKFTGANFLKATNCINMLSYCLELEEIQPFYFPVLENATSMFAADAKLKSIHMTTSNKLKRMPSAFTMCTLLEDVTVTDISGVIDAFWLFGSCPNLKNVQLTGLNTDISFFQSPLLTRDSVLHLFNNALPTTATKTITLHADTLALLSPTDIAIATDKGYTVTA